MAEHLPNGILRTLTGGETTQKAVDCDKGEA